MKAKGIILLLLFCPVILFFGCRSNKSVSNNIPEANNSADSLVAYLERTPCFGVCPYYSIKIYKSGFVLYEGNRNVKNIGKFYTFLSTKQVNSIGEKAMQLGYFDLDDEYRNPHLTDFPTIYSEIHFRGKQKKITHYTSTPPQALVEVENYVDQFFNENTNWMLMPEQK